MSPAFAAFYYAIILPKFLQIPAGVNTVSYEVASAIVAECTALMGQWFNDHPDDPTPHAGF